jgi:hypothetical protein
MRRYIRHPFQIPIRFHPVEKEGEKSIKTKNMSTYGICFSSEEYLAPDTFIELFIPSINPDIKMRGRVVWSEKKSARYDIGIEFVDKNDEYRARMIEQVCHIKDYKDNAHKKSGRHLTDAEAAEEWIKKHANDFPK